MNNPILNMKYPIIFMIFAMFTGYKAIYIQNLFIKALLVWLSFSLLFLAIVYLFNEPEWLGKKQNGKIKVINLLLYLPCAIISYIVWHLQRIISQENPIDEIVENKIWCGRRILGSEFPNYIDTVIDLTSEFHEPGSIVEKINYISIPLLDGIQPDNKIIEKLKQLSPSLLNKRIFIHCAQGHGRTATVTVFIMKYLNLIDNLETGLKMILELRHRAKVSNEQLRFIKKAN